MPGRIYLHSLERDRQLGFITKGDLQGKVTYVLPSREQVEEMRKQWQGFSIHVVTMDQLVRQMYPCSRRWISSTIEKKLIDECMEQGEEEGWFSIYHEVSLDRHRWIQHVEQWMGEMKRAGVTPVRLQRLWAGASEEKKALVKIYERYQQLLEQRGWMDQEEYYQFSLQQLRHDDQSGHLYVFEHFYDLHAIQEQLMVQLITAGAEVELHLIDGRERIFFQPVAKMMERLLKQGFSFMEMETKLQRERVESEVSLQHLQQHLFCRHSTPSILDDSVEVRKAIDIEHEVRQAIRKVKDWLQDPEIACRNIALISNQADLYRPWIHKICKEASVPIDAAERKKVSAHPLGQSILAALHSWNKEIMWFRHLLHLKKLDVYFDSNQLKRLLSSPIHIEQPFENVPVDKRNTLKKLLNGLEAISEECTLIEWSQWLKNWIHEFFVFEIHVIQSQDEFQELAEFLRVREKVEQWCEELLIMAELDQRKYTIRQLIQWLESSFSQINYTITTRTKGGIRFLDASNLRGERFTYCILLGCQEGCWPVVYQEDWLCNDEVKKDLQQEYVHIPTSLELQERQMISFFFSVLAAQQQLVLSYSIHSDQGEVHLPSSYIEECKRCFTSKSWEEKKIPTINDARLWLRKKDVLHATLAKWAQIQDKDVLNNQNSLVSSLDSLYIDKRYLADLLAMEWERRRQWQSPTHGQIPAPQLVFGDNWVIDRVWNSSELQILLSCRFRYLAERVWGVNDHWVNDGLEIPKREWGKLLHRLFAEFYRSFLESGESWEPFEDLEEPLLELYQTLSESVDKSVLVHPLVAQIEKQRNWEIIKKFLGIEQESRKGKNPHSLQPRYFELSFGTPIGDQVDPNSIRKPVSLQLTNDLSIQVSGRIDRVDVDGDYYSVYDYKTGSGYSYQDLKEGKQIQIPLYLWVLASGFGFSEQMAVGGAIYTKDHRNRGLWRKELAETKAGLKSGKNAMDKNLLEENEWQQIHTNLKYELGGQIQAMAMGNFQVRPKWSCPPYCAAKSICRYHEDSSEEE